MPVVETKTATDHSTLSIRKACSALFRALREEDASLRSDPAEESADPQKMLELRIVVLADRGLERDRSLRDFANLLHLVCRHAHLASELGWSWIGALFLGDFARRFLQLVDFLEMCTGFRIISSWLASARVIA